MKIVIPLLLLSSAAFANTGEMYGFGSRASGGGNTMLHGASDSFATYYNPAANSNNEGFHFSFGVAYMHPKFKSITGVTLDNPATSPNGNISGTVDTEDYHDHIGQTISASYNLGANFRNLTIGMLVSSPITRLAYIDSGEPFKPEYYGYRARTQRPQFMTSVSTSITDNLHVALGAAYNANVTTSAKYTLSSSAGTVSHGRMSTTVKPTVSPYGSVYYTGTFSGFETGLTVRAPNNAKMDVDINSNARMLGSTGNFPIIFNSTSSMYYDPLEVDFGIGANVAETFRLSFEVDWLNYSAFKEPTATVSDNNSAIALRNSVSSRPTFKDIWVPKAGFSWHRNNGIWRFGYMYRESPVKDNSGVGNLVDPTKHVVTAGFGYDLRRAQITRHEMTLDLHAQYHYLVSSSVTKGANTYEVQGGAGRPVGASTYEIGGSVYGGGMSVSMLF